MSEAIPVAHYNNVPSNQPDLGYTIYPDPHLAGYVRVDTGDYNDTIELIWHEDGSLTIVINAKEEEDGGGGTAIRLDAIQAQKVIIDAGTGNDMVFVTGDTPSGNKLWIYGNDGDDELVGSDGEERLSGGEGSDIMWGMGGNDELFSRFHDNSRDSEVVDYLYGGAGDDHLHGWKGDHAHGNAGADTYYGGEVIQFNTAGDVNPTGALDNYEVDAEKSEDKPAFASDSNADRVPHDSGVAGAEEPVESDESDPAADAAPDLGPGAPPDDLPTAETPIGNENMEVPEEPAVPLDASTEEQPQLIFDQLRDFYKPTIEDLNQASEDCLAQAKQAADEGDMDAAKAWAAKADWYASQAERLSAAADVRFGIAVMPEESDGTDNWFNLEYETVKECEALAEEARATADEAELVAGGAETDSSESESATEEPSEEPTASEPEATHSPDLPSTLPGGGTAAGQVFHFHNQLTGFYADEIDQALDNTQTYAENAQTAAASGDTEGAQQWARMALLESARADQLLQEAHSRLNAAEQQLNEVLNDPDATDAEKATAQEQYDEAKLAVETAETQVAEAAGFAEEARVTAELSEDDDGSVPSADAAPTEPGEEGTEDTGSAAPSADGSEPGAGGVEPGSEGSEAPGAGAAAGVESDDDPYDQAMDNAIEGTARQESDRKSRGKRSGNFLIAMAEAMGLMQAKFLGNAMKHLDTMDSLSSQEIPEGDANAERQHRESFLIAQSMFQAEMQMFNIVSQASATALRSTGEGMSAVVRKN